ncbi:hypothetical protein WOLCODRAFT_140945 [Wolfiporia cocos MD-104 SS10]|uniref:Wax synthase domain-containing protein n=1 Tax=Wolfiporia cocos (strain MD-104) TaxID=742152 RepID=A0A2H3J5R2_WOLCO|nr:hypothetical protein WOLCODRAFT_140945 [Wolfiporia cocos MD-104 SS10]
MYQCLTTFSMLWMVDPLTEYRHERDVVHPLTLSFMRRAYWVQSSMLSCRGVGWNFQVANVPPRLYVPRANFVYNRLFSAIRWYLLADAVQSSTIFLRPHGHVVQHCIFSLARFGTVITILAMQFDLLSVISVALGFYEPHDWPGIFGRWSDAYSVRRWRTYHQMLRRHTAAYGKRACRCLGLHPGSWASSYTQLYVGFAVSGLMHCGGDLMVRPAICDAVLAVVRKAGIRYPHRLARLVGYAWVVCWLGFSTPWLIEWSVKVGITESQRIPFSIITTLFLPYVGSEAIRSAQEVPLNVTAWASASVTTDS